MGELKGAILSMILFVAFILPFLLFLGIQSIHQNAFMKVTTEVQQMVEYEGGITGRVQTVADNLHKKGYDITFANQKGQTITGKQPVGTVIEIKYKYKYTNVYREQVLETSNFVSVMRR